MCSYRQLTSQMSYVYNIIKAFCILITSQVHVYKTVCFSLQLYSFNYSLCYIYHTVTTVPYLLFAIILYCISLCTRSVLFLVIAFSLEGICPPPKECPRLFFSWKFHLTAFLLCLYTHLKIRMRNNFMHVQAGKRQVCSLCCRNCCQNIIIKHKASCSSACTIDKNRFFPLKVSNNLDISQEWCRNGVCHNLLKNTETNIDPNEAGPSD